MRQLDCTWEYGSRSLLHLQLAVSGKTPVWNFLQTNACANAALVLRAKTVSSAPCPCWGPPTHCNRDSISRKANLDLSGKGLVKIECACVCACVFNTTWIFTSNLELFSRPNWVTLTFVGLPLLLQLLQNKNYRSPSSELFFTQFFFQAICTQRTPKRPE